MALCCFVPGKHRFRIKHDPPNSIFAGFNMDWSENRIPPHSMVYHHFQSCSSLKVPFILEIPPILLVNYLTGRAFAVASSACSSSICFWARCLRMCFCVHICMYIYVYIYIYMHTHIYICICACMYRHTYT